MKKLFFLFTFIFGLSNCFSYSIQNAEKYYNEEKYKKAINEYIHIIKKEPITTEIAFKLSMAEQKNHNNNNSFRIETNLVKDTLIVTEYLFRKNNLTNTPDYDKFSKFFKSVSVTHDVSSTMYNTSLKRLQKYNFISKIKDSIKEYLIYEIFIICIIYITYRNMKNPISNFLAQFFGSWNKKMQQIEEEEEERRKNEEQERKKPRPNIF